MEEVWFPDYMYVTIGACAYTQIIYSYENWSYREIELEAMIKVANPTWLIDASYMIIMYRYNR